MRRGDLYRYQPVLARPGQSTVRLIVSSDALNEADSPTILAIHILSDDPGSLLAPYIEPLGWALVTTIERVVRSRLFEHLGTAADQEMEQVDIALRAALNL